MLMRATVARLVAAAPSEAPSISARQASQRGGVGRGLDVALLRVLAPDVDGQPGEAEQHDQDQREDHQHLAAHQFTTIVAVARWTKRPLPSVPSRPLMNGTMTSTDT